MVHIMHHKPRMMRCPELATRCVRRWMGVQHILCTVNPVSCSAPSWQAGCVCRWRGAGRTLQNLILCGALTMQADRVQVKVRRRTAC